MSDSKLTIILIGLNVQRFLPDCLESVRNARFPADRLEKIYVDSGSVDQSCQIVQAEPGWRVLHVNDPRPSVAKGRNLGIQHATSPLVQLLDADMLLEPDWLHVAVQTIERDPRLAAVFGRTVERYPDRNIYHAMRNALWSMHPVGPCHRMPGASLLRLEAVRQCDLHRQNARGFEDVELAQRLSKAGFSILGLPQIMCRHDSDMSRFSQYWRSNVRGGQGNYDILKYLPRDGKGYFLRELRRSLLWLLVLAGGLMTVWLGPPVLASILLGTFGLAVLREIRRGWRHGGSLAGGASWSCHWVLSKIPYCVGFAGAVWGDTWPGRRRKQCP